LTTDITFLKRYFYILTLSKKDILFVFA